MPPRIMAELKLLHLHFSTVDHKERDGLHWFRIEPFNTLPDWTPDAIPVAFSVTHGHPGAAPYGFYVPTSLTYKGAPPAEAGAPHQPPFDGQWRFLSWQAVDWQPTDDVATGSNLWAWTRSFRNRLEEGQ